MALTLLGILGGVALLAYAADQFVVGAARVALLRRIPALVVGVVIIGFGTSSPELLVSTLAAARDEMSIAIGNVVGSNIANLSLLVGIGALIVPLAVNSMTVRREGFLAAGATVAFALAVRGGGISRVEGALLMAGIVAALLLVVRRPAADPLGPETRDLARPSGHSLGREVGRTLLGLAGTVVGAQLLLWGAVDNADRAGLSAGFVGATLVAVGTSLPELVTVIQSARRGQADLIVGNLLGSNIFNALVAGGAVGLVGTDALDSAELSSLGSLAAVAVAGLAVLAMRTAHTVTRREGVVLVLGYLALLPFLA